MKMLLLIPLLVTLVVAEEVKFMALVVRGTCEAGSTTEIPVAGEGMFNLGQEYQDFLTNGAGLIRSTDDACAVSSGKAILEGIFDKSSLQNATTIMPTTPMTSTMPPTPTTIPRPIMSVHGIYRKMDYIMGTDDSCTMYNTLLNNYKNTQAYTSVTQKYSNLMKYLSQKTGKNVNSIQEVEEIFATFQAEKNLGLKIPKWAEIIYPSPMNDAVAFGLSVYTATPMLARLKVGPLLNQIVSHMEIASRANENDTYIKMMVYVGNDSTIVNVLNGLGLFDGRVPQPGAAVLFELVVDADGTGVFVKVRHNTLGRVAYTNKLTIPNCKEPCHLQHFKDAYQPILTGDWHSECFLRNTGTLYLLIVFFVIIMAAICICEAYVAKMKYEIIQKEDDAGNNNVELVEPEQNED